MYLFVGDLIRNEEHSIHYNRSKKQHVRDAETWRILTSYMPVIDELVVIRLHDLFELPCVVFYW